MSRGEVERVRLGDVASISAGQGAPQGKDSYCSSGIPFIKAGNLNELELGKSEDSLLCVNEEVATRNKLKLYKSGSVLFAKSGMSCMKGLIHVLTRDCYVVSHLAIITPHCKETSGYLKHYFKMHKPNKLVKDAAYPSISLTDISDLQIPLPALSEQERIAGELDRICELKRNAEARLQKLDLLVKAKFSEMFGDCKENVNLIGVCEIIDGDRGENYPKQADFSDKGFCLFLSAKNITKDGFKLDDCSFISEEKDKKLRKGKLMRGDVILTTRGTVGNIAYYGCDIPFDQVRINSGMVILRLDCKQVEVHYFIMAFKRILDLMRQKVVSGSAQPQLPISVMKKIIIPLPPRSLQREFADFVEKVEGLKGVAKAELEKVDLLYRARLQEYFG